MRRLNERNKTDVCYALYEDTTITQDEGLYTGENIPQYGEAQVARMVVGIVTGTAALEQYGIEDGYAIKIVTDDTDCPITTASVLWLALGDVAPYDASVAYVDKQCAIKDGKVQRYDFSSDSWKVVPHTHVVTRVAKSFGYITYLAKEVSVTYEAN